MDEDTVSKYFDALIERQVFYVVDNGSGRYLADTQQLYNFEMLHTGRAYDRNRKYGDESSKEETTAETTTTPVKEVAPDAPICDLPSDEEDPFKDFKDY